MANHILFKIYSFNYVITKHASSLNKFQIGFTFFLVNWTFYIVTSLVTQVQFVPIFILIMLPREKDKYLEEENLLKSRKCFECILLGKTPEFVLNEVVFHFLDNMKSFPT